LSLVAVVVLLAHLALLVVEEEQEVLEHLILIQQLEVFL
jgi:hypothetical protein